MVQKEDGKKSNLVEVKEVDRPITEDTEKCKIPEENGQRSILEREEKFDTPKNKNGGKCVNQKNSKTELDKKKGKIVVEKIIEERGKYLKPCPNIKLIHNRPLRRRQDAVIQNGSILPPVLVDGERLQLMYTCPFDSAVEVLATAYMDSKVYHTALDEINPKPDFFRIVIEYAVNGVSNFLYTERASFLLTIKEKTENLLRCDGNIGGMLEKFLLEVPSVLEETRCSASCGQIVTRKSPVLHVSSTLFHKKGIRAALEESVNASLRRKTSKCSKCKLHSRCTTKKPGIHVFIDVEHVYNKKLAAALGYPQVPDVILLQDIPGSLTIDDIHYTLIGVIRYMKPAAESTIGHYIAYCRRITGRWEEHNSLKSKVTMIAPTALAKLEGHISVIAYVRA